MIMELKAVTAVETKMKVSSFVREKNRRRNSQWKVKFRIQKNKQKKREVGTLRFNQHVLYANEST